jgi:hypothetical protein
VEVLGGPTTNHIQARLIVCVVVNNAGPGSRGHGQRIGRGHNVLAVAIEVDDGVQQLPCRQLGGCSGGKARYQRQHVLALKRPRGLTQCLYLRSGLAAQGAFLVTLQQEVGLVLEVVLVRGAL